MDMEMLCRAFQETRPWIDDFRKRTYEKAFQAYTERFGSSYLEAAREAGRRGSSVLPERFWTVLRRAGSASVRGTVRQFG